jgi:hypothetical protein
MKNGVLVEHWDVIPAHCVSRTRSCALNATFAMMMIMSPMIIMGADPVGVFLPGPQARGWNSGDITAAQAANASLHPGHRSGNKIGGRDDMPAN